MVTEVAGSGVGSGGTVAVQAVDDEQDTAVATPPNATVM
jgi:hypothetical protein